MIQIYADDMDVLKMVGNDDALLKDMTNKHSLYDREINRQNRLLDKHIENVSEWSWNSNKNLQHIKDVESKIIKYGAKKDRIEKDIYSYAKYKNILNDDLPEKYRPMYRHYVFKGTPGQKVGEVIDLKQITPDIWKQKSRAHEGGYSSGLSLAGFTPIIFTKPDSANNIFNK